MDGEWWRWDAAKVLASDEALNAPEFNVTNQAAWSLGTVNTAAPGARWDLRLTSSLRGIVVALL